MFISKASTENVLNAKRTKILKNEILSGSLPFAVETLLKWMLLILFFCQLFSFTFYFILFCLYLFHILKVCGKRVVKIYNNTFNSGTNK